MMIGRFFDAHADGWREEDRVWYTELLEEQDVDIMAWAIGSQPVPERFQGELMTKMQKLDYLPVVR